jgi:hypothetical protein
VKEPKGATGCWLIAFLFCAVMAAAIVLPAWRCAWCEGYGASVVAGEHEGRLINVGGSVWAPCNVCGASGRTGFVTWVRVRWMTR